MKREARRPRLELFIGQAGVGLLWLLPGCEPINAEIIGEFVGELARGALAAWLL